MSAECRALDELTWYFSAQARWHSSVSQLPADTVACLSQPVPPLRCFSDSQLLQLQLYVVFDASLRLVGIRSSLWRSSMSLTTGAQHDVRCVPRCYDDATTRGDVRRLLVGRRAAPLRRIKLMITIQSSIRCQSAIPLTRYIFKRTQSLSNACLRSRPIIIKFM